MARCIWYNVRKFVSDLRQVGGFLHQWNWPPRYNWNIDENGVKHHNHTPYQMKHNTQGKKKNSNRQKNDKKQNKK